MAARDRGRGAVARPLAGGRGTGTDRRYRRDGWRAAGYGRRGPSPTADLARSPRRRRPVRLPRGPGVAHASSTTSVTPGPSGSGCGAGPTCGYGRCARSPSSGPGPARRTARIWRPASARGSPSAAGSWCRVPPSGSTARRTAAHSAAGGATVAVLACGVDVVYPRGHAELIGRIAEQGLVIGELPPGDHPTPSRFILRNRVIAALTRGTVVVEAEYRSGSLVTARERTAAGPLHDGSPGARPPAGSRPACMQLLRGEARAGHRRRRSGELVGDIGDLAPDRRGPVLPRDLLDPVSARVLEALPARGAVAGAQVARGARTTADDDARQAVRTALAGFCRTARRQLAVARGGAIRGSNARRGGT